MQSFIPRVGITNDQLKALQEANILDYGQSAGQSLLKAYGDVPTINIPISVVFTPGIQLKQVGNIEGKIEEINDQIDDLSGDINQINNDLNKIKVTEIQLTTTVNNEHRVFLTPPSNKHILLQVACPDATPRLVAGKNWDGSFIVYCPTIADGTSINITGLWAEVV